MKFRLAINQDKNNVLNFCKNTFKWGDYIDRVWDIWISEPNSRFLVAETEDKIKKPIGIIHGILIPEKIVWVEGIRVDPEFRKQKVATNLINIILEYGRKNGAVYSSAIVSIKNQASKKLMEKLNFEVVSDWSYISTNQITYPRKRIVDSNCKIADADEYQQIINFLKLENSKTAGTKFVDSWRWYNVTKDRILDMIHNNQIMIIRQDVKEDSNNNQKIKGLAILDKERHHNNQNIFQIGYIDAESEELLCSLIDKSIELALKVNRNYNDKTNNNNSNKIGKIYEKLQIFTPFRENNFQIFPESRISFNEQFLLYSKKIT